MLRIAIPDLNLCSPCSISRETEHPAMSAHTTWPRLRDGTDARGPTQTALPLLPNNWREREKEIGRAGI